jgi:hypothetical protein
VESMLQIVMNFLMYWRICLANEALRRCKRIQNQTG